MIREYQCSDRSAAHRKELYKEGAQTTMMADASIAKEAALLSRLPMTSSRLLVRTSDHPCKFWGGE